MKPRSLGWIVGMVFFSALLGCEENPKSKECESFVGVVNPAVTSIQKMLNASEGKSTVEELTQLATSLDGMVQSAEGLYITDEKLKQLNGSYQSMVKEIAAGARDMATAVANVDADKMKAAKARIGAAVDKEDALVEDINAHCQAP
ncbi:MAG: hypothetical protein AAGA56_23080 [Myxococcota bacterium]